jgi:hypothetical protein
MARLADIHFLFALREGEPSSLDDGRAIVQRCADALAALRVSP